MSSVKYPKVLDSIGQSWKKAVFSTLNQNLTECDEHNDKLIKWTIESVLQR